jgi:hypothetical protein
MRRIAPVFAAIVVCAMAGCTPAKTPRAPEPTPKETIDAQIAKDNAIRWSAKRPLTWADFHGRPPDRNDMVAAETAYSILHGASCAGSKFDYTVVAAFRPKDSWVKLPMLRTPADNTRALKHEQTHFDLAEVHARRIRRYYAELTAPCRLSTNDLADAAHRMDRDQKAAQEQYDDETDHGRNPTQQARWEKTVASDLASLAKFAQPPPDPSPRPGSR